MSGEEATILKVLAKNPNSMFKDVWAVMKDPNPEGFAYKDCMKVFFAMAKEDKIEKTEAGKTGLMHKYSAPKKAAKK